MKNIDKELEGMALEQDQEFDKKIQKMIDKRMRRNALKVIGIVVIIAVVVFFVLSPLVGLFVTNPARANKGNPSTLLKTMRAYYDTTHPYMEVADISVKKNGFGCYTMNIDVVDHSDKIMLTADDPENTIATMKLGKIAITSDGKGRSSMILGRFYSKSSAQAFADNSDIISEISKLPASAHLYLSVTNKKLMDVSTLLKLQNDDFQVEWLQIYQKDSDFQPGVSAHMVANLIKKSDVRDNYTSAELRKTYISELKTMYENHKLFSGLQLYSSDEGYTSSSDPDASATEALKQVIGAAEKNKKFQSRNYCISGSRDAILKYLKSTGLKSIQVDKVKYSTLAD